MMNERCHRLLNSSMTFGEFLFKYFPFFQVKRISFDEEKAVEQENVAANGFLEVTNHAKFEYQKNLGGK